MRNEKLNPNFETLWDADFADCADFCFLSAESAFICVQISISRKVYSPPSPPIAITDRSPGSASIVSIGLRSLSPKTHFRSTIHLINQNFSLKAIHVIRTHRSPSRIDRRVQPASSRSDYAGVSPKTHFRSTIHLVNQNFH